MLAVFTVQMAIDKVMIIMRGSHTSKRNTALPRSNYRMLGVLYYITQKIKQLELGV